MPDAHNTRLNWPQSLSVSPPVGPVQQTKLLIQVRGPHVTTSKKTLAREFSVSLSQWQRPLCRSDVIVYILLEAIFWPLWSAHALDFQSRSVQLAIFPPPYLCCNRTLKKSLVFFLFFSFSKQRLFRLTVYQHILFIWSIYLSEGVLGL